MEDKLVIKVKYTDYSIYNKSEKLIEGNLPKDVKYVEVYDDDGRGYVRINEEIVLDSFKAQDYGINHKGVSISVDSGSFYFGANGVLFQDLDAGSDFSFIFEQV